MSYQKTVWKNREVERPRTYNIQENEDGTITLIPAEGAIIEPGTPITAQVMQNIEDGIEVLDNTLKSHLADSVPVKLTLLNGWTGDLYVRKLGHGLVQIYGDITPGVTDRATVIATLPEGYLVPYFTQIPAHSGVVATGGILGFSISATGNFSIYNPAASANLGTSYIRFNHIYKTI